MSHRACSVSIAVFGASLENSILALPALVLAPRLILEELSLPQKEEGCEASDLRCPRSTIISVLFQTMLKHKCCRNCVSMGHKYQMPRPHMACLGSYLALYDAFNECSCCGSETCPLARSATARLLPLLPDSAVVLHQHHGLSVIVDGEGFIVEL